MRFMGVDPGSRRIGLALGDDETCLASPHKTLFRKDDPSLLRELLLELRTNQVDSVVLGLPLRMNGLEGPEAKRARAMARAIEQHGKLSVVLWDERLTTVSAERQLRAVGLRGDKKKRLIDQAAATVLLQSYLDARSSAC